MSVPAARTAYAYEIDDRFAAQEFLEERFRGPIRFRNQYDLRLFNNTLQGPVHQCRDVRYYGLNVSLIGADQACQKHLFVIHFDVIALSEKPLDQLHYRTIA